MAGKFGVQCQCICLLMMILTLGIEAYINPGGIVSSEDEGM
jgi:hypothetical protein